ncbi:cAMP-binding domain of CRP or a regulatory subunit of cAMP-dependent protein kinases [Pseudomonas benzenivorans]|nr:Crp/Fnr family transcriptional regulator [Pseudomonas benzenivorans]SDG31842.1 cAMP-binding domain of CRP or a regulatory subunit of cAMP-dependent protein kinases [Pseudomonas benzenivorans]
MTSDSLYDCLACAPQLPGMLDQHPQLAELWQELPRQSYVPNQQLLAPRQLVDRSWFIVSGLVRVVHLSEQGLERNAAFHAEGSWVGWGTPPYATPSPVAIVALEPTVALELRYDVLRRWQSDLPVVQEILSDAIRAVLERSAQREAELLLLDAGERYKLFLQQRAALVPRIPLHHVASYLGITNVALSRIRARMGLVQARRSK